METNKIIEGNKLIAEFMKWPSQFTCKNISDELVLLAGFHRSWDMLMPVVEKIQADSCKFSIEKNYCKIWAIGTFEASTTIEAVWLACVEFIKWYNDNK